MDYEELANLPPMKRLKPIALDLLPIACVLVLMMVMNAASWFFLK